jgi:hypothetical protein
MVGMKPKMHQQIQPREVALLPVAQVRVRVAKDEAQKEIRSFLRAVNSYPARVAKEPHVSFQQHLSSTFAAPNEKDKDSERDKGNDRRDRRSRRH